MKKSWSLKEQREYNVNGLCKSMKAGAHGESLKMPEVLTGLRAWGISQNYRKSSSWPFQLRLWNELSVSFRWPTLEGWRWFFSYSFRKMMMALVQRGNWHFSITHRFWTCLSQRPSAKTLPSDIKSKLSLASSMLYNQNPTLQLYFSNCHYIFSPG